jgi:hypothetical protein
VLMPLQSSFGNLGQNPRVLGWGVTNVTAPAIQNQLSGTLVTVRNGNDCMAAYNGTFDPVTQLCANGPNGEGACIGDDGPCDPS